LAPHEHRIRDVRGSLGPHRTRPVVFSNGGRCPHVASKQGYPGSEKIGDLVDALSFAIELHAALVKRTVVDGPSSRVQTIEQCKRESGLALHGTHRFVFHARGQAAIHQKAACD
jgi:hypothetical protein